MWHARGLAAKSEGSVDPVNRLRYLVDHQFCEKPRLSHPREIPEYRTPGQAHRHRDQPGQIRQKIDVLLLLKRRDSCPLDSLLPCEIGSLRQLTRADDKWPKSALSFPDGISLLESRQKTPDCCKQARPPFPKRSAPQVLLGCEKLCAGET